MASAGIVTTAVEQAFFHRAEDGTASVLASSLDGEQAELAWIDQLGSHLGGIGAADASRPVHALGYFTFPEGFAAVLRRSRTVQRPGTVDFHALLGLAEQLTPAVALAARDWPGWQDEPPVDRRMPRLRPQELHVPDTGARLRARALAQGDMLARSLAWLLQSPKAPLGLLGCPQEDRTALVWALLEIASPRLGQREWTFCTHGVDQDGSPAAITFFDTPPARTGSTGRIIVDLRRGQGASPLNEYRANAMVYRYEYGVDPPGVDAAPGQLSVPVPVPAQSTAPVPAAPTQIPPTQTPPTQTPPTQTAPTNTGPPAGWAVELVQDLTTARDERSLDSALTELEHAVAALDDRHDVRTALENVGWAASVIHRQVPFYRREKVYDRVVQVAFGATDPGLATPGARAEARRLAESSDSDELVRALVRAGDGDELAPALARRWIRQHQPVMPDPAAGLGPVGRFFLYRGLAMTPARERRLLGAMLVLALLLSCLVGLVVGGVVW